MMINHPGLKHNVDELLVGVLKQILLRQVSFSSGSIMIHIQANPIYPNPPPSKSIPPRSTSKQIQSGQIPPQANPNQQVEEGAIVQRRRARGKSCTSLITLRMARSYADDNDNEDGDYSPWRWRTFDISKVSHRHIRLPAGRPYWRCACKRTRRWWRSLARICMSSKNLHSQKEVQTDEKVVHFSWENLNIPYSSFVEEDSNEISLETARPVFIGLPMSFDRMCSHSE